MAEKQVQKILWEDGRHAERRIVDWHVSEDGVEQREVELFLEPERQLNLKQRVVEKRKPVVYHRTTQVVDGDKIIDQMVEERDEDKLQIVEHIGVVDQQKGLRKAGPSDCEQLTDQVRALVQALTPTANVQQSGSRRMSRSEAAGDVQPPLQGTVANKIEGSTALIAINLGLSLVIVGLLSAIGYCLIFV